MNIDIKKIQYEAQYGRHYHWHLSSCLNVDIALDDDQYYIENGHPLLMWFRNGYDCHCDEWLPVLVCDKPSVACDCVLKIYLEHYNNVKEFVRCNQDFLRSVASGKDQPIDNPCFRPHLLKSDIENLHYTDYIYNQKRFIDTGLRNASIQPNNHKAADTPIGEIIRMLPKGIDVESSAYRADSVARYIKLAAPAEAFSQELVQLFVRIMDWFDYGLTWAQLDFADETSDKEIIWLQFEPLNSSIYQYSMLRHNGGLMLKDY